MFSELRSARSSPCQSGPRVSSSLSVASFARCFAGLGSAAGRAGLRGDSSWITVLCLSHDQLSPCGESESQRLRVGDDLSPFILQNCPGLLVQICRPSLTVFKLLTVRLPVSEKENM